MVTEKMYRYLGRNGNITSKVLLESVTPIPMFKLIAAHGKILTDGVKHSYSVIVFEDEVENWKEVDDTIFGQN